MLTLHLQTKLYVPPPRPNLVARPRLIERLREGVELGRRLTLITAPPGFGKTTLISDWIGGRERPAAWLTLDEGDNDPAQFLTYLIAALQQIDGHIGQTALQVLRAPQAPPPQRMVASLINDIAVAATALTLVLDDYHLITSAAVHEIVHVLLDRAPPLLHLVICTREDPPLPLPRLRAQGLLTELRERDLRFTAAEAAAFLHDTMGLRLSPEAVRALETRTEGWIAGLQLAALAMQENPADTGAFIAAFTGDNRYVMDYLVTEVLQRQPLHIKRFLLQTSILDRLCGPLCDAVLGTGDQGSEIRSELLTPDLQPLAPDSYSRLILEELERANLFLIPLDQRREWYRYHHLFADVLRTRLGQDERRVLHQRAAHWYEANGHLSQAIHHALAAAALDDAARLIRQAAEETIHHGSVQTVRNWLDALPDESIRASLELATYKGWVLALSGERDRAEHYADLAEQQIGQIEPPPAAYGKLLALRAFTTLLARHDYERAIELAARALQALSDDQPHWRIITLWVLAESQERSRPISEAIATLRDARRTGRALGNTLFAPAVEFFLASALNGHGERLEALAVCEEAIERYVDAAGHTTPVATMIASQLAMLHYEANQLDQARMYLDTGRALSEQLGLTGWIISTLFFSAPILFVQGETGAALEALQHGYRLAAQTDFSDPGAFLAVEADIRLKQGDLLFAIRWAETAGLSPDDPPQYLHIERQFVYCRLLLAQGRAADARRLLARMERFTQERGLYRWLITVHILLALSAERSGNHPVARDHLAQAVRLAAPGDYVRAFLDEDAQVIALLPAVRHVAPAFVSRLLERSGHARPQPDHSDTSLIEPLSERELEVLRLIAAGLSNPEVARELVITVGTVKRHINNIYGKLAVHSRTQAVAKARVLRLLG